MQLSQHRDHSHSVGTAVSAAPDSKIFSDNLHNLTNIQNSQQQRRSKSSCELVRERESLNSRNFPVFTHWYSSGRAGKVTVLSDCCAPAGVVVIQNIRIEGQLARVKNN